MVTSPLLTEGAVAMDTCRVGIADPDLSFPRFQWNLLWLLPIWDCSSIG